MKGRQVADSKWQEATNCLSNAVQVDGVVCGWTRSCVGGRDRASEDEVVWVDKAVQVENVAPQMESHRSDEGTHARTHALSVRLTPQRVSHWASLRQAAKNRQGA